MMMMMMMMMIKVKETKTKTNPYICIVSKQEKENDTWLRK
jgi:hypothetical protein